MPLLLSALESAMSNKRWIELKAVRGRALLIDSERIFTLAKRAEPSGYKAGEFRHWGVIYAILTEEESQACAVNYATCPLPIGYRARLQSQTATISRAYIDTLKDKLGKGQPVFLGVATPIQCEPIKGDAMLNHVYSFQDWIKACLATSA